MKEKKTMNGDARVRRVAWERVTKIDDLLRAGKYPNCVTMAKEFGVSVRTVKRDIEFMVDRHNLPIEYDQKRWGYFYSCRGQDKVFPHRGLDLFPFAAYATTMLP
jgi:hypothetical protein